MIFKNVNTLVEQEPGLILFNFESNSTMSNSPKDNNYSAQFNWACEQYLKGKISREGLAKEAHIFLSKKTNNQRYQKDRADAIQDAILNFHPIIKKKVVEKLSAAYLFEIFKNCHFVYFSKKNKEQIFIKNFFSNVLTDQGVNTSPFLPETKPPPILNKQIQLNNNLTLDVFSVEKDRITHQNILVGLAEELNTNGVLGKKEREFLELLFDFLKKNPNELLEIIFNKVQEEMDLGLGAFRNLKTKVFKNISYLKNSNVLLENFQKNIFKNKWEQPIAKKQATDIYNSFYKKQKYHAALTNWIKVLEKFQDPYTFTFWSILYNKANAFARMEHSRLAEKWFLLIAEKMLYYLNDEIARQFVSDVWNQLGNIYEYREHYDLALKFFEKALDLQPKENSEVYLVNIFRMKIYLVQLKSAEKIFKENSKNELFLQLLKCVPEKEMERFKKIDWFNI